LFRQRHDSLSFEPVMAAIRIRRRGRGRPRARSGRVLAAKAYSSKAIRVLLRRRKIKATIPQSAGQASNGAATVADRAPVRDPPHQHRTHRSLHGAAPLKPLPGMVDLDQYRVRKQARVMA
jgi:hypothetical protein